MRGATEGTEVHGVELREWEIGNPLRAEPVHAITGLPQAFGKSGEQECTTYMSAMTAIHGFQELAARDLSARDSELVPVIQAATPEQPSRFPTQQLFGMTTL